MTQCRGQNMFASEFYCFLLNASNIFVATEELSLFILNYLFLRGTKYCIFTIHTLYLCQNKEQTNIGCNQGG